MAIVFITGSSDGLGRAAALSLLDQGHRVVLHARSTARAAALGELVSRSDGVVVGDLQSRPETKSIADGARQRRQAYYLQRPWPRVPMQLAPWNVRSGRARRLSRLG